MKRKRVSYSKYGYFFVIPFVLAWLIFQLYPIAYTVIIGFTDLRGVTTREFHFLPDLLGNFKDILNTPAFQISLQNTVFMWILNFIPQMLLSLFLAVQFTKYRSKVKGSGFFKVVFYMPNIITAASVAILFFALFGFPIGPVNDLLVRTGVLDVPFQFFTSRIASQLIVAFIQFWMWYGVTMIILIAGINGISPTLFEAAEIDGASNWQIFLNVTLPSLRSIIVYTLITSLIGGMQMFDIPRNLVQNQGPDQATLTVANFIYNQAFMGSYMFNRAAAASLILFAIIAVLSAIVFFLLRDKDAIKEQKIQKKALKEYKAMKKAEGMVK